MLIAVRVFIAAALMSAIADLAAVASEDINTGDTPYLELPIDKKNQLIKNLQKIKLGDGWGPIKNILGDPDLEYEVGRKETIEISGIERVYFVYRISHLANVRDRKVRLYFDFDGNLKYIHSNIGAYHREEGAIP